MKNIRLLLVLLVPFIFLFSGCEDTDDEEENCTEAPLSCDTSPPDYGYLNIEAYEPEDATLIEIRLFRRELESVEDYTDEPWKILDFTDDKRFAVDNGFYTAVAIYTVGQEKIVAIDGEYLSYESSDYCDGVTCYDPGSIYLDVSFDNAAYTEYREGSNDNCFIATAAFGNKLTGEVADLRRFRDRYLMHTSAGRAFVGLYYRVSPPAADFIRRHGTVSAVVRFFLAPAAFYLRNLPLALFLVLLAAASVQGNASFYAKHIKKSGPCGSKFD